MPQPRRQRATPRTKFNVLVFIPHAGNFIVPTPATDAESAIKKVELDIHAGKLLIGRWGDVEAIVSLTDLAHTLVQVHTSGDLS